MIDVRFVDVVVGNNPTAVDRFMNSGDGEGVPDWRLFVHMVWQHAE